MISNRSTLVINVYNPGGLGNQPVLLSLMSEFLIYVRARSI